MKKIIGILIIIIGIICMISFIYLSLNKETKLNMLIGKKECNKIEIMTADITNRRCIICLKKFQGSSSEIICHDCSCELNCCSVCGGRRTNLELMCK